MLRITNDDGIYTATWVSGDTSLSVTRLCPYTAAAVVTKWALETMGIVVQPAMSVEPRGWTLCETSVEPEYDLCLCGETTIDGICQDPDCVTRPDHRLREVVVVE